MIAAQFGSTKVLSFLLEQGADVAATVPEDGCTALQVDPHLSSLILAVTECCSTLLASPARLTRNPRPFMSWRAVHLLRQVAESFSDASTSTKMIEMIREALQKMPSTSTYPPQRPGGGRQGGEQYMTQPYQHYQVRFGKSVHELPMKKRTNLPRLTLQGAVHHVYPQPSHQDDGGFPDPNSELVLPDFSSDEFRVYHFKVWSTESDAIMVAGPGDGT